MRKAFRYTWIVLVLLAIYLGWMYYLHRRDQSAFLEHLEENRPKELTISEAYSSSLSILNFYAVPQTIRKGEKAELCYGVSNAETVQIEPPVGDIWPSYSLCVEISPAADATYTLTATDSGGNTAVMKTAIKVIPD